MKLLKVICFLGCNLLLMACKPKEDKQPQVSIPSVYTTPVYDITANSAKSGGTVTYSGNGSITERGVCWSVNQFPTIENTKTINGSGTGDYGSALTGLLRGTTYFVRAYARDANGTIYGNEIKFETNSIYSVEFKGAKLYIHPTDNANLSWGAPGVLTGANSITDGNNNTVKINNLSGNYAAKICSDLEAFGFSDWYLPSKEELNTIYQNRVLLGIANGVYWSSTEVNDQEATSQNMQSGVQYDNTNKSTISNCRCVRKN